MVTLVSAILVETTTFTCEAETCSNTRFCSATAMDECRGSNTRPMDLSKPRRRYGEGSKATIETNNFSVRLDKGGEASE